MSGRVWTREEEVILSRMYADHFAKEIADILGRGVPSVYCHAALMGLKSSEEKIRRSGRMSSQHPNVRAHSFHKGNVPFNKGRKMPPEVYAKVKRGMFKKGLVPWNHAEVGTERISKDGYVEVKIAEGPRQWRLKHRLVWEKAHGKIPKGYNVQFRNHDRTDCRLENLYLISRKDQMRKENSFYAKYPKDLQEIIHLKGVVNRAIHKAQRNGK